MNNGKRKLSKAEQALLEIQTTIGGCFGDQDCKFAGHAFDENHAKELRSLALKHGLALNDVVQPANNWLLKKGCNPNHIYEQMSKVRAFFGKEYRGKRLI